ncbi:MAG: hypothetical protein RsTaC01_0078 [Candidatus Paraimprobicoccus trichonymphae]|uniref:Lipoprotein n=1 Tax=Candidatus Paraimprobicoccus trichonymphae TaxID=3033793 RepID=A0AA48I5C1_9FIRM|nr:MAG: hypothetical protein RsTaC01_0078 [Candidatus Paraimprobicoccus trichonymphae]
MFNKKINKILAGSLALGLSFVGCNFKALDTKPHEVFEWAKVNPVKSVLISLAPFVGAGLICGGHKFCKYLQSKNEEIVRNHNLEEHNSEEKIDQINDVNFTDFYTEDERGSYAENVFGKIIKISKNSKVDDYSSEKTPRYCIMKINKSDKFFIEAKGGQKFFYAEDFDPKSNKTIDYIKIYDLCCYFYYLNKNDIDNYTKLES